jgi:CRISPR-associated protein Cas4
MIKELIDEFYRKKQNNKGQVAFYATDSGRCPRAIYFSMKNYPKKESDARVMRIFEHGDHTHMRIMAVLFSLGLVTAAEISIPENEVVRGRADAIISFKGEPYVVEIKSVNSVKFKKNEPDFDHIRQLQLYLYFFNIKKGILIYENKDNQDLKEFVIEYDENIVKKSISFFNSLKENVEKSIIPEIPKDIEDWRCEYCPYVVECEKVEEQKNSKKGQLSL